MGGVSLEREGAVGVITIENPPVNAMSPGVPGAIVHAAGGSPGGPHHRGGGAARRGNGGALAGADITHRSASRGRRASRRCAT